jgi:CheY-like chemotaxis protein
MSINAPIQTANALAKILVVDDNNLYAKTIGFKLRCSGYQVATALNGAEAISLVRSEKPDLVLLDINFPPDVAGTLCDGFSIMEWIHRMNESQNIPFIIISGDNNVKNKECATAKGAAAFLHKPFNHDELLHAIQSALKTNGSGPT